MTDEQRARARAYYAAHKERKAEIRKACYERNKEKNLAYARAHYAEHKEEMREWAREYYQKHKEERKAYQKQRYADMVGSRGVPKKSLRYKPRLDIRRRRWREMHPEWRIRGDLPHVPHNTLDLLAFGEMLRRDRQEKNAQKEGGV